MGLPCVINEIRALWRGNFSGGLRLRLTFEHDPDGGEEFSRELLERLWTYDEQYATRQEIEAHLAGLGAHTPLRPEDATRAIQHIYWLQVRGHLVPDPFNGVMWLCSGESDIFAMETNPCALREGQPVKLYIKPPSVPGKTGNLDAARSAIHRTPSRGKPN